MELHEYQVRALETDQATAMGAEALEIHLLGLAGEAGSVAAEYKKRLRDGSAHSTWPSRMGEELGDVLWYVAAIASQLNLDLEDIAAANLAKTRSRWCARNTESLDARWPEVERLPRRGEYVFVPIEGASARPGVEVWFEARRVGSRLTDAASVEDGYRFHDVFHLSYATMLGWSPVTRLLLSRKRQSDPTVDENEDGGRAIVIEEGVSALVFAYAAQHQFLEGVPRLDQRLLDSITMLTATTEAAAFNPAEWERAIIAGFACFRSLVANEGGTVTFDADARRMEYRPDRVVANHEWSQPPDA